MNNLLIKELRLGIHPVSYLLPVLFGALMLIPAWLYFLVPLYFCFITVPNMFGGYKSQNDLMFTKMLPVSRNEMVKARIAVVIILELLHLGFAAIFGLISTKLYPNLIYYFFAPSFSFFGLCFVMMGIFNLIFFTMYYKTAYKYGAATFTSVAAAVLFAVAAEWLSIANEEVFNLFKGSGADSIATQITILAAGIAIFATFTVIAYNIANKKFEKVEI